MSCDPSRKIKLVIGIILASFSASHAVTGFLANVGWFHWLGIEFDAWYVHPAYQSVCWFAMGIAVGLLVPLFVDALRSPSRPSRSHPEESGVNSNVSGTLSE